MMLRTLLGWLTGGALDRILRTVDRQIEATTDRERIKAQIIATHYTARAGFMQAGGFALMLLFAIPLAFWFAAVCVYSVFWCAGCAFPQEWTIAALPPPLDQWSAQIVIAIFGVAGLTRFARKQEADMMQIDVPPKLIDTVRHIEFDFWVISSKQSLSKWLHIFVVKFILFMRV